MYLPQELVEQLRAHPSSIQFIRNSQNRVYSFKEAGGIERILRLTAESHRSIAEIQDELDWLMHLNMSGASVCPPVRQSDGAWITSVLISGEKMHAVVFEKASGRPPVKADLSFTLYRSHGRHLGKLHALSRRAGGQFLRRRNAWHAERYFTTDIQAYLPEEVRVPLLTRFEALKQQACAAPATEQTYGPVHFDLGYANFFISKDDLEIFDFDNCTDAYYIGDIAAALYGGIFTGLRCDFPGDRSAFEHPKSSNHLAEMLMHFRKGYESANQWLDGWNEQLQLWFEIMYFRSVMHAFRMQYPLENPKAKALLYADLDNILKRELPVRIMC